MLHQSQNLYGRHVSTFHYHYHHAVGLTKGPQSLRREFARQRDLVLFLSIYSTHFVSLRHVRPTSVWLKDGSWKITAYITV